MKVKTTVVWEIQEWWMSPKDLDKELEMFEQANPVKIEDILHETLEE